jgi:hypothetical protein
MSLIWDLDRIFFFREHILISRRYQLRSASATTYCSSGITDAHNQKIKKNYKEKKVPLQYSIPTLTPPRQHHKSNFFKSDASKKEIVYKRCRRPIKDLDFHPEESPRSQNNPFNKVIARRNQLRQDREFSP